MEELSKTQIVLLTLLVSFVTSIATGIVTVALVDQSSQGVGATIQTVVEKTIQTVIPGTSTSTDVVKVGTISNNPAKVPTESDKIVSAVSANTNSIVRIEKSNTYPDPTFVGLGLIISKNGTIIADKGLLQDVNAKYIAVFPDGNTATLTPATIGQPVSHIAIFSMGSTTGEKLVTPILGDSAKVELGQKIIALSGGEKLSVTIGIISSIDKNNDNGLAFFQTDFSITDLTYGSVLLDLDGEVIGIKVGKAGQDDGFLSSNDLKKELGI